jgi:hypothetical protein
MHATIVRRPLSRSLGCGASAGPGRRLNQRCRGVSPVLIDMMLSRVPPLLCLAVACVSGACLYNPNLPADDLTENGSRASTTGASVPDSSSPTGSSDELTGSTTDPDTSDSEGPVPPPDSDADGFADDIDLCPSIPSENNSVDSDGDGIGDACDVCPLHPSIYNADAEAAGVPVRMQVRNIPHQVDSDRDGVGDVCDNCVVRGNCGEYGDGADQTPASIGEEVPFDDASVCQVDVDGLLLFVGDACIDPRTQLPLQLDGAAGPVGVLDNDDLDQDGLANIDDACPRIRASGLECASQGECEGAACTDGVCNHLDIDNDGVGDECDTCPSVANPKQTQDGGMQQDDPDQDFVGNACESHAACADLADPRPIGFYDRSAAGECCVVLFDPATTPVDPGLASEVDDTCSVVDPAVPLRADCEPADENVTCRRVPAAVLARSGVGMLPTGCLGPGYPLTLGSPGVDDHDDLYKFACRMPPRDQDFDGLGDACDLCPRAFDPDNTESAPGVGKFCHGAYDPASNQAGCP